VLAGVHLDPRRVDEAAAAVEEAKALRAAESSNDLMATGEPQTRLVAPGSGHRLSGAGRPPGIRRIVPAASTPRSSGGLAQHHRGLDLALLGCSSMVASSSVLRSGETSSKP